VTEDKLLAPPSFFKVQSFGGSRGASSTAWSGVVEETDPFGSTARPKGVFTAELKPAQPGWSTDSDSESSYKSPRAEHCCQKWRQISLQPALCCNSTDLGSK